MHQYRVRLLKHPVMLYNGHSYERASTYMDEYETHDRILERREPDGWQSVISVQGGK